MGLLDDAIREHLELKRRRGADPGEVAREQREALAPIPGRADSEDDLAGADLAQEDAISGAPLIDPADGQPPAQPELEDSAPRTAMHAEDVGSDATAVPGLEETAELDMSSVLGEDAEANAPADASSAPQSGAGDSLEWEMPADAAAREQAGSDEPDDEDVLEETPDFLRETPEQDRLWFEQRPPRDFDFDK
jgi:hypothetical protein